MTLPDRLKDRPLWKGRFPVPFTSFYDEQAKEYDLKVIDVQRQVECIKGGLCALCGQTMHQGVWFIGGPMCAIYRAFRDTAMHEECARYALQTCPHLAISKGKYAPRPATGQRGDALVMTLEDEPEKVSTFMLGVSDGYQVEVVQNGNQQEIIVRSNPWMHVEWWKDGEHVLPPPEFMRHLHGLLASGEPEGTIIGQNTGQT